MKKKIVFTVFLVCSATLASLSHAEIKVPDCGQLLVPSDRAMLGVEYVPEAQGLRVKGVVPGGPAQKAGLVAGDLIVEINGDVLLFRDRIEAAKWLNRYRVGQALDVAVHRNGATSNLELHGERISCEAARRLDRLLRAAESGGLESCSTDEAPAVVSVDSGPDPIAAFMDKFRGEETVLVLTAGAEGTPIRIETDVSLRAPLEFATLPGFMRELAERLDEGESISFRVTIRSAKGGLSARYEPLTYPARFSNSWPKLPAAESGHSGSP